MSDLFVSNAGTNPIWKGFAGGIIIAFLNLVGALLVLVWRNPSQRGLDGALGFAAGGMLYVISDEIIPETHTRGHERTATLVTMLGLVVMLVLDVALG